MTDAVQVPRMTGWVNACMTTNDAGEQVTAHTHYRDICHAYPGPNGEVMVAGHALSKPLERWIRHGQRKHSTQDPADRPPPPCPVCGTPVDIEWYEVTVLGYDWRSWVPTRITCPANRFHDARTAAVELSWPVELTDEDRVWLRRQIQLAKESP